MSEKLCTLRTQGGGGGAKQVETVLWTNSAPTSTFNAQTVTLSDSVRNYDYLKFVYNLNNENQTTCSTIMSVSDFVNTKYQAGYFVGEFGCMATTSGTLYPWSRPAHYDTDTTIAIKNCITVGTSVTINTRLIPTAIIGIKNIGGTSIKSQFKEVVIACSPSTTVDTLAGRAYEVENAQSGDTLTGIFGESEYLSATSVSGTGGYNKWVAKKDLTALIIKGYGTATYTVANFTTGQTVVQLNRKSGDLVFIGIF